MPRDNFNNIGYSVITIIIVIMGEGWSTTMYQWVRAFSYYKSNGESEDSFQYWLSLSYFLILMIVGNFILLSLFTAILLQNFDTGSEQLAGKKKKDEKAEAKLAQIKAKKLQGSKDEGGLKSVAKLFKKKTYYECFEKFQMMFGKKESRKS